MFEQAAAPYGFLVCPRGNAPMSDGSSGKMWSGSYATVAPGVHAALDAAGAMGALDRSGGGHADGLLERRLLRGRDRDPRAGPVDGAGAALDAPRSRSGAPVGGRRQARRARVRRRRHGESLHEGAGRASPRRGAPRRASSAWAPAVTSSRETWMRG